MSYKLYNVGMIGQFITNATTNNNHGLQFFDENFTMLNPHIDIYASHECKEVGEVFNFKYCIPIPSGTKYIRAGIEVVGQAASFYVDILKFRIELI